eukprot:TRINITY_DN10472_c0_g1_i2.p1 TRINITY_DN10472_c0_g1~~TRINITY_DN10472_c0_g1_i2.p1  ORF type:complete len:139 (+),score=30.46 TRINITY_DN10472_c0_g1_i2:461-877(+)
MVESIIPNLGDSLDALYDVTIAYEKPPRDGFLMTGSGDGGSVHMYVKRIPIGSVPRDPKLLREWIYNLYKDKDLLLEGFYQENKFPGKATILPKVTFFQHFLWLLTWVMRWLAPPAIFFYLFIKFCGILVDNLVLFSH